MTKLCPHPDCGFKFNSSTQELCGRCHRPLYIIGVDEAKPGTDKTVVWNRAENRPATVAEQLAVLG